MLNNIELEFSISKQVTLTEKPKNCLNCLKNAKTMYYCDYFLTF